MAYILVRHQVEDPGKWKPQFDGHSATREASGSRGGRLYRNAQNPNEFFVLMEWDSLEKAQQFAGSADLRERMQAGGVVDHPDVYFLEEVEGFSH
jgi:heme-degrading monooxygenase HmoA